MIRPAHTARYQGSDATIRYRFHAQSGERVEIVRPQELAGGNMLVIRQPDGTLAAALSSFCSDSTNTAKNPWIHWGSCQNAPGTPTITPTRDRRPGAPSLSPGGNRSVVPVGSV